MNQEQVSAEPVLPWQSVLLVPIVLTANGRCCGHSVFRVQIDAHIPLVCTRICP